MIVVCPSCSRRYLIDDHLFRTPTGKDLRCAACGHQWTATIDTTLLEPTVEQMLAAPHPTRPRRSLLGWALYCACILLISGTVFLARDLLVYFWPPIYTFYETLDLQATPPHAATLHFENLGAHYVRENGEIKAVVSGAIVNHAHNAAFLPPLKVIIAQPCQKGYCSDKPLHFQVTTQRLLGGEKVYFETPPLPTYTPGTKAILEF